MIVTKLCQQICNVRDFTLIIVFNNIYRKTNISALLYTVWIFMEHLLCPVTFDWLLSCDIWLAVVLWRLIGCYENQNEENGPRDTVDRSCDMLSVEVCQVWVWVLSKGSRCCLSKNRYHHWSVLVGFRNINGFMADLHKCWIRFP